MYSVDNINQQMNNAMDYATVKRKGFWVFNRLGMAFIIFMASQIVLPSLVYKLFLVIAPDLAESGFFAMPLVYVCMYLIGLPLMLRTLRGIPDNTVTYAQREPKKLSLLTMLALYPLTFAIMSIFSILMNLVEQLIIGKSGTVTLTDIVNANENAWIPFVFGVIVAPIMEELVFRRMTYKKVSGYGVGTYLVWTSIVFGLFHGNFGQAVYTSLIGVLFAVIMYQTGSVRYSIILHILLNLTAGVGMGSIILRSGNQTATIIYSCYTMALTVIGIIIGIVMLARKDSILKIGSIKDKLLSYKAALLNPGTIIYIVICIGLIISHFV